MGAAGAAGKGGMACLGLVASLRIHSPNPSLTVSPGDLLQEFRPIPW